MTEPDSKAPSETAAEQPQQPSSEQVKVELPPELEKMEERGNPGEEEDTATATSQASKKKKKRKQKPNGKDDRGCCRKMEEDENLFSYCIGALCLASCAGCAKCCGECCEICDD